MKIYSYKLLLLSLVMAGGIAFGLSRSSGFMDYLLLLFPALTTLLYFYYALTRDGYERYLKDAETSRTEARKRLGRFAFLDGMSPIIFLLLAGLVAYVLPEWKWLIWLLFIYAMILLFRGISENIARIERDLKNP